MSKENLSSNIFQAHRLQFLLTFAGAALLAALSILFDFSNFASTACVIGAGAAYCLVWGKFLLNLIPTAYRLIFGDNHYLQCQEDIGNAATDSRDLRKLNLFSQGCPGYLAMLLVIVNGSCLFAMGYYMGRPLLFDAVYAVFLALDNIILGLIALLTRDKQQTVVEDGGQSLICLTIKFYPHDRLPRVWIKNNSAALAAYGLLSILWLAGVLPSVAFSWLCTLLWLINCLCDFFLTPEVYPLRPSRGV